MKQIAIVGGGFSGVAVAWNLLQHVKGPARVLLFSKEQDIGRGLAYGTPSPHHFLNVPAGRMGLDPTDEGGFFRYLTRIGLPFHAGDFVPRTLYGSYLEHSLGEQRGAAADRGVELRLHHDVVESIEPLGAGRHVVHLAGGARHEADAVVLALGNFPSRPPTIAHGPDWASPGLHATPWSLGKLGSLPPRAAVLLVGTGLTAFDVILQLRHQGHRGVITMVSRRGLLAQAHRKLETPPERGLVPAGFLEGMGTAVEILRETRRLIRHAQSLGHDWRDVIGGLRQMTPRIWQQLPTRERQRFLRHLLPYWDTHRHRAAVPIAQAISEEISARTVLVMAGRLESLQAASEGWVAGIQLRGSLRKYTWTGGAVVNCTGPSSDLKAARHDTLIQSMLNHGRVHPDALSLGVEVDGSYQLLDAHGKGQEGLYYVGPMLKAQFWEATAVPELRMHARAVSQMLLEGRPGLTG